jgi:DNA-binding NarL/FixJ family response regulator
MIKVIIVDDHPVVRRGLKQIIEDEPDMEVVGDAKNAGECFSLVRHTDCTLVVRYHAARQKWLRRVETIEVRTSKAPGPYS